MQVLKSWLDDEIISLDLVWKYVYILLYEIIQTSHLDMIGENEQFASLFFRPLFIQPSYPHYIYGIFMSFTS